jgi:D-aminopeptidase
MTDVDPNGRPKPRRNAEGPVSGPPKARCRPRDLGIVIGLMPPGPTNSIVDVPGVKVGHATIWRDEPKPPAGRGTARTGVTAILPGDVKTLTSHPVHAGVAVLNGTGEVTGRTQIDELGAFEGPILLTSTMAVGRVYDAAIRILVDEDPKADADHWMIPVVAECSDSYLNHARHVQVDVDDVRMAIDSARGAEAGAPRVGVVGAGTGMVCHELKGGIGSASRRVVPGHDEAPTLVPTPTQASGTEAYTVAALALTNYGWLEQLIVDGVRVGPTLVAEGYARRTGPARHRPESGSLIVVVATDAPLDARQLQRLARRAGLGMARTGGIAGNGSGDIFLAFTTAGRMSHRAGPLVDRTLLADAFLDPLFAAAAEATEEAALDSLVAADTVQGRDGHTIKALPLRRLVDLLAAAGHPARLPAGMG